LWSPPGDTDINIRANPIFHNVSLSSNGIYDSRYFTCCEPAYWPRMNVHSPIILLGLSWRRCSLAMQCTLRKGRTLFRWLRPSQREPPRPSPRCPPRTSLRTIPWMHNRRPREKDSGDCCSQGCVTHRQQRSQMNPLVNRKGKRQLPRTLIPKEQLRDKRRHMLCSYPPC
jgi:hypothetical protein